MAKLNPNHNKSKLIIEQKSIEICFVLPHFRSSLIQFAEIGKGGETKFQGDTLTKLFKKQTEPPKFKETEKSSLQ